MNLQQLAGALNPRTEQPRVYQDGEVVLIAGTLGYVDRAMTVHLRLADRETLRALRLRHLIAGDPPRLQREPEQEEIGMLRKLMGLSA